MSISIRFVNPFNKPSAKPTYATHQLEPIAQTHGRRTLSRAQYTAMLSAEANLAYRKVWIFHSKRDYVLYQCWFDEYARLEELITTVNEMSIHDWNCYKYEMRLAAPFAVNPVQPTLF